MIILCRQVTQRPIVTLIGAIEDKTDFIAALKLLNTLAGSSKDSICPLHLHYTAHVKIEH